MESIEYLVFIIGRDLLHDNLVIEPNDTAFKLCTDIVNEFRKSEESKQDKSEYDCLVDFIDHEGLYHYSVDDIMKWLNEKNKVYYILTEHIDNSYDGEYTNIVGIYDSNIKAEEKMEQCKKDHTEYIESKNNKYIIFHEGLDESERWEDYIEYEITMRGLN